MQTFSESSKYWILYELNKTKRWYFLVKKDILEGNNLVQFLLSSVHRKFQWFYGLPETGILDNQTLQMLKLPRCGQKDWDQNKIMAEYKIGK